LIIRDLAAGPRRFVELQRVLPGISTEQLRSRLNRMVADGMLTRKRYREVPPRVDYELTERAREVMPILGELARWGYEWAWGTPRQGERVDIAAIFRLAPGLASGAGRGRVECTVTDGKEGAACTYSFTFDAGGLVVAEERAADAGARVSGDTAAWVSAFAPDRDRAGLRIEGDGRLAGALLDELAAIGPRAQRAKRVA
jgi:DNA-binding HxlR family transcriptional regulator